MHAWCNQIQLNSHIYIFSSQTKAQRGEWECVVKIPITSTFFLLADVIQIEFMNSKVIPTSCTLNLAIARKQQRPQECKKTNVFRHVVLPKYDENQTKTVEAVVAFT